MKVLLTGTRAPVTLDLAAALAACGHEVHGIDSLATAMTAKVLTSFTLCAPPAWRFDDFARDAQAVVSRLQPDLIVPLCEDIFYWAKLAEHRGWPLLAPSLTTLMRLHSKLAFIELAQSLGLPVPATRRLTPGEDITPGDWVYKPEFSRFGVHTLVRPRHAPTLPHDPANPWVQQAWIAGEDLSFHAIAHGGQLRAFAAYRSVWRAPGGASYYFDPVEPALADRLETMAATLAHGMTGQFACDLRHDPDGGLWLIECNPRATSGLHLLSHDPDALCGALTGSGNSVLRSDGVPACLGPMMWLYGLPSGRYGLWRADLSRARDVLRGRYADALRDGIGLTAHAALSGRSLQAFLTADIECNRDLSCA